MAASALLLRIEDVVCHHANPRGNSKDGRIADRAEVVEEPPKEELPLRKEPVPPSDQNNAK
mgnify:CR=1 FL=1